MEIDGGTMQLLVWDEERYNAYRYICIFIKETGNKGTILLFLAISIYTKQMYTVWIVIRIIRVIR